MLDSIVHTTPVIERMPEGDQVDPVDRCEQGMPSRSAYIVKRAQYDNNTHLDFDLYDAIDTNANDVRYDDNASGDFAGLDESMQSITRGDPYEVCVTDINSTTMWMHQNMSRVSRESVHIVSGYGMFQAFGALYMVSSGETAMELKNYFGFQDKKHLNAGLLTIGDLLRGSNGLVTVDCWLVGRDTMQINQAMANKIKPLIRCVAINPYAIEHEASRVNALIRSHSHIDMALSANTLARSRASLFVVSRLAVRWADALVVQTYPRYNQPTQGVCWVDTTFDYYQDQSRQFIELPMQGNAWYIGLVISKNPTQSTDLKTLSIATSYMKPCVMDRVVVPMIRSRYRVRMNGILQSTGLKTIFTNSEITGLFVGGGALDDCIHVFDLDIGSEYVNDKKSTNNKHMGASHMGARTGLRFIVGGACEFYLRHRDTGCVVCAGRI